VADIFERGNEPSVSIKGREFIDHLSNYQLSPLLFNRPSRYCFLIMVNVKVKVKLPLCLTKHHAKKMYWGVEV
jgi:hypothetical protein